MILDCPRALTEPPTCLHPQQIGSLSFSISVEYDVNAVTVECVEKTCACDLTEEEWSKLEEEAWERRNDWAEAGD